ncbi:hypothetical protein JCM10212_001020 [Sporobolomyces blumeae]
MPSHGSTTIDPGTTLAAKPRAAQPLTSDLPKSATSSPALSRRSSLTQAGTIGLPDDPENREGNEKGGNGQQAIEDPTDLVQAEAEAESARRGPHEQTSQREGHGPRTKGARAWSAIQRVVGFLVSQWFVLGVGFVIGMAAAFPNVARTGGVLEAEWSIKYLLVAIIFLISGLTLPLRNLYRRLGDWKLHVVTQSTSFFIFPTIVFAIINCVRAADPNFDRFNRNALIGMMTMSVVPTTVSSNVVMTGQAGGDESAATVEVVLGNLVGTFLSPALLEMFFSAGRWEFARPQASGSGGIGEVYRQVIEQLGYTVFIPLFVGEVIQYMFPRQTKLVRTKLRLGKVGSLCLLGVVWSTFSTAFYEDAFEILTGAAVAFIVGVDIFLYLVLSIFLFLLARHVPYPRRVKFDDDNLDDRATSSTREKGPLFDPETTIALLFCGAAKGAALGAPIVAILYGGFPPDARGIISLPIVLYQGSQIVLGQVTVAVLKAWHKRILSREGGREGACEKTLSGAV